LSDFDGSGEQPFDGRWNGCDEGNEISGDASAELQQDGSLEIELSFDSGDDATLTAQRA
jgi:hypothetical protein